MSQSIKSTHGSRRTGLFLILLTAVVFYGLLALGIGALLAYSGKAAASEADYADPWCAARGGRGEVVLADRTRADCLIPGFAVEVDFAAKWAEAMGQALHYGRMTGRMPGVLLILKKPGDVRYKKRLLADADYWGLPLFVWTVGPGPAKQNDGSEPP